MLALARAWRIQYCGGPSKSETGESGGPGEASASHKAKTRAEKDWEVAEYLKQHGVQRDVKTAATKWDNMLGDFRRVHEWERSPERDEIGKSYFRLSQDERKMHRLPASFDEDVYEEMVQYIGHRPRSQALRGGRGGHSKAVRGTSREPHHRSSPKIEPRDMSGGTDMPPFLHIPRSDRPSYEQSQHRYSPLGEAIMGGMLTAGAGSSRDLMVSRGKAALTPTASEAGKRSARQVHRIGRIKMVWEESVHIWGEDDGTEEGRLKLENVNFLHADELVFLDENFTGNAIEAFENGPLQGLSTDTFACGQQLKVFDRRKAGKSLQRFHKML